MNKAEQLINHLADLPALVKERSQYSNQYDLDNYMSDEEKLEYEGLQAIERLIRSEVEEARKTVVRVRDDYPPEYQAILARLAELEPALKQARAIKGALFNLNSLDGFVTSALRNALYLTPEEREERVLRQAKEAKERAGSKVVKINKAGYATYQAECKRIETDKRYELEAKYATELARKEALEELANSRRLEKLHPINDKIRALLDSANKLLIEEVK